MRRIRMTTGLSCAVFLSIAFPAGAETVTIETLNKKDTQRFVYSEPFVRIEPGEAVRFVATDKGHNAVSVDGMLPGDAPPIDVPFNQGGEFTLSEPGIYGIQCEPHAGLGMVALIVVGESVNREEAATAAVDLPPKARARFRELMSRL